MKKNLFERVAIEKMIERVSRLNKEDQPLWGEMTAAEMLLHCNLCNNQILDGTVEPGSHRFKTKLIKLLALYIVPHFPKHMKSAEKNITKNAISADSFESEKYSFITTLRKFSADVSITSMPHPAFGFMNKKEWGIAAWKHTDHHLRQFGV